MMLYKVIIPHLTGIDNVWLLENLGGPITHEHDFLRRIVSGPTWKISKLCKVSSEANINWLTIGEFENETDAICFKLSWL